MDNMKRLKTISHWWHSFYTAIALTSLEEDQRAEITEWHANVATQHQKSSAQFMLYIQRTVPCSKWWKIMNHWVTYLSSLWKSQKFGSVVNKKKSSITKCDKLLESLRILEISDPFHPLHWTFTLQCEVTIPNLLFWVGNVWFLWSFSHTYFKTEILHVL